MVLGDQYTAYGPTFYSVDPKTLNVTNTTVTYCPKGYLCDIVQASIRGKTLLGPDAFLFQANLFKFPAGGESKLRLSGAVIEQPNGSAFGIVK
jgi:hypothetical protein